MPHQARQSLQLPCRANASQPRHVQILGRRSTLYVLYGGLFCNLQPPFCNPKNCFRPPLLVSRLEIERQHTTQYCLKDDSMQYLGVIRRYNGVKRSREGLRGSCPANLKNTSKKMRLVLTGAVA
eukprot:28912-Amphidinium_carterae.1